MCLNNDTTIAFNRRGILASVERQYRKSLGDSSCAEKYTAIYPTTSGRYRTFDDTGFTNGSSLLAELLPKT